MLWPIAVQLIHSSDKVRCVNNSTKISATYFWQQSTHVFIDTFTGILSIMTITQQLQNLCVSHSFWMLPEPRASSGIARGLAVFQVSSFWLDSWFNMVHRTAKKLSLMLQHLFVTWQIPGVKWQIGVSACQFVKPAFYHRWYATNILLLVHK